MTEKQANRLATRKHIKLVENLQLLGLGLTIIGQILVRFDFILLTQVIWLIANLIALGRDFYLERPAADKIKNACLTALTAGLVISILI